MSLPLVSYIVITMNRPHELAGCLTSIRTQDYPHKQIIVVDNGSSDNSVNLLREQFPEIEFNPLERNYGVAGGRNRGIEMARGEICIFLDDDAQFVHSDATAKTLSYFQADPQLACLAFFIQNAVTGLEDRKSIPRVDKRHIARDYPCGYFCGAGFAVKRLVFSKIGMFWERLLYGGEDLDFSYRLLNQGYQLLRSFSIKVLHDEVLQTRPPGQWVYVNARNRCWIATKNLPWRYVISTSLLWWSYTALISLQRKQFHHFARSIRDSLLGLPTVLQERHPVSRTTLRNLKELSGRRWY